MAVRDVLEKQFNFFARDDITDVFRPVEMAEGKPNHLVAHHSRPTAVAGIDGRVNLNSQTGNGKIIAGEFDAGHDAFGDGKARTAFRITIDHDRIFDLREQLRARQCRMRVEECFIIQLEHGEINSRRDALDRGGNFIAGLIGLHLHLAGVKRHMGARENPFAFDDDAAAGDFTR